MFRRVPYRLKQVVGRELDRLEECGVLRRVDYTDWAAPIVPVHKNDGSLRICSNYKLGINPHLINILSPG